MANIEEFLLTDIAHKSDLLRAADGDLDKITGVKNLKDALFHRLLTYPGSLAHRPDYGVGIKDFQNAPNTIDNQRALALRIKEQFEQDFRVREFSGMRVVINDNDPGNVTIVVRVKINGLEEAEMQFVPFGSTEV